MTNEVINRIKDFEEIHVGDEVYFDDKGRKAVVTRVIEEVDLYNILFYNGDTNCVRRMFLAKTGNHYDGIASILKQMKGEEDNG